MMKEDASQIKPMDNNELPNFLFSRRMCTSLISPFCHFSKCLNKRKCKSLDNFLLINNGNQLYSFGNSNSWEYFQASDMEIRKTLKLGRITSSSIPVGLSSGEAMQKYGVYSNGLKEESDSDNESDVVMPDSLRRIFFDPHILNQSTVDSQPVLSVQCRPQRYSGSYLNGSNPQCVNFNTRSNEACDKECHQDMHYVPCNPKSTFPQSNVSNVSTISSSSSFPSLMGLMERRDSSSESGTSRSSTSLRRRDRRFSDSDGNSSVRSNVILNDSSSPGENWYYYDMRMRPGESLQVGNIASTLLEFFHQLRRPTEPLRPPSYDTTVAANLQTGYIPDGGSSMESGLNHAREDEYLNSVSESDVHYNDFPPPYTESDEPPAYGEICEPDYQNIYEIINDSSSDHLSNTYFSAQPFNSRTINIIDFVTAPSSDPGQSRSNFCLRGRPAVRWNVQSRVERWATSSGFGQF